MTHTTSTRGRAKAGIGLTLAAVLLFAAGCSSEPTDTSTGSDFSGRSITVVVPPPLEIGVKYIASKFGEQTGATVNVTTVADTVPGFLVDQLSGSGEFDAVSTQPIYLGELVESGAVRDLTDWVDERTSTLNPDDFLPSFDRYSFIDGRRYSVPFDGDTIALFYNKEILARNGFTEPPRTWQEYAEQVETITKNESSDGVYGAVIRGANNWPSIVTEFADRLAGFGGTFTDDEGSPTINTPEAVEAAQALLEAAQDAYPTPSQVGMPEASRVFESGDAAFLTFWLEFANVAEAEGSAIAGKWGVTTIPVGDVGQAPRADLSAGNAWAVSATTDEADLTLAFVEFASGTALAPELPELPRGGLDYYRASTLNESGLEQSNPGYFSVAQASGQPDALRWPNQAGAPEAIQDLSDALSELLASGNTEASTVQAKLDTVQKQWVSIFDD